MKRIVANIIYYLLLSPLILLGVLPIYLIVVLDTLQREERWVSVAEFRSELKYD